MRKKIILLTVLCMGMILSACGTQKEEVTELNISVAASLVNPIDEMIELYTKDHPVKINVNSGGSGTLKKQISEGADIGLFFSANEKYVVELIDEGLVKPSNKSNLIYNTLVVIKNKEAQTLNSLLDIKENGSMLAIGEVSTVPAGEYAKESLTNLGLWDELESSLIYGKDVTAVKTYVECGEVDYGIVYKTDEMNLENGEVMMTLPTDSYQEIVYSLASIEGYSNEAECLKFMDFIKSDTGKSILKNYGFEVSE